jgi:enterochelin esterase-like enzyme
MTRRNHWTDWLMVGLFLSLVLVLSRRAAAEDHPDRVQQTGVPHGEVTSGRFTDSQIFPGTTRDYSVYVPARYTADQPANLMVFMDGAGYANPKRAFRVPVVFDNLIQQKAMPVTIAVFVNPGTIPATAPRIFWSTNSCPSRCGG